MIAMAVTRRHLSSDRKLLTYLFMVRQISDSRVLSLQLLRPSLIYLRRFLEPLARSFLLSLSAGSSVEEMVDADDGIGLLVAGGEGEGEIWMETISSWFDIGQLHDVETNLGSLPIYRQGQVTSARPVRHDGPARLRLVALLVRRRGDLSWARGEIKSKIACWSLREAGEGEQSEQQT